MAPNQKTILLLGASADQTFAIRRANNLGYRVVVVDGNPKSPGFPMADDFAVVSTRDIEALTFFVDEYIKSGGRIDGICVMGSDIPQFVAMLAEHLSLPHIPIESANLSTDKLAMKQRFKEKGVSIPWFQQVSSAKDVEAIIDEQEFALIIKPVDRSGARGVLQITPGCNVADLFNLAQQQSFSGKVIVEECLLGPQISTESIVYQGKAYTPGFVDRNYDQLGQYAPYIIENGGWEPSRVTASERKQVEQLIEQAALALGVTEGVIKGDIVLTDTGPKIIEVATRLSGGDFSESLIPLGSGINHVDVALQMAVGDEPDLTKLIPRFQKAVGNRYFFPAPGRLVSISGLCVVKAKPFIKKLETWYQVGDIVPEITSHADRFGVFIVVADTLDELEERIKWVYETVVIQTVSLEI